MARQFRTPIQFDTGNPGTTITNADGTRALLWGSGTPESNVTASVGALYLRTDGSTGTTLYIKESGAGNTGWVAVAGVGSGLSDHLADASDAHDASAVSYAGGTGMSATDVEAAIDELATEKMNIGSVTVRVPHTWSLNGTGAIDTLPGFYISLPAGQTAALVACRYADVSGTATVSVRQNGTGATGFTAISVTSTAATTDPTNVTLADNDYIDLDITAAASPVDLRVTAWVEYTV